MSEPQGRDPTWTDQPARASRKAAVPSGLTSGSPAAGEPGGKAAPSGGPEAGGGRKEGRKTAPSGGPEASGAAQQPLTHLDEAGHARMVDVSGKDVSARQATASGRVLLSGEAIAALRAGTVPKGDALAVARIAGIQGAKRTPDLVPLCHPIALHSVTVDLTVNDDSVGIVATTRTADRTGVEMEALTSVTVAALALIDMVKAVDPAAVISDVRVEEKLGGKTGTWRRP